MKFKSFLDTTTIEEGWLSKLFGKPQSSLGPIKLPFGGSAAKSYGCHTRSAAIAAKWAKIRQEGDAERAKKRATLGGSK